MTPRRRALLASGLAAALPLVLPSTARAGSQVEEPLADSVRGALAAAIANSAPPEPHFITIESRLAYLRWLGDMSNRLQKRQSERATRLDLLQTVWYESTRAGLEPALVLGVMQVESGFRKYAVSSAGARGYMQVMPFWARQIGDGDASRLFVMQINLRFGCVILRHYLRIERGDMFMALGRYNGSRGRADYPNLIFGARRQWVPALD